MLDRVVAFFWKGPLDGQTWEVDRLIVIAPVFMPFTPFEVVVDYAQEECPIRVEYVEYRGHLYKWVWNGEYRERVIMTTSFADALEVEGVMQFLETLF